jgi:hypothetical protein
MHRTIVSVRSANALFTSLIHATKGLNGESQAAHDGRISGVTALKIVSSRGLGHTLSADYTR